MLATDRWRSLHSIAEVGLMRKYGVLPTSWYLPEEEVVDDRRHLVFLELRRRPQRQGRACRLPIRTGTLSFWGRLVDHAHGFGRDSAVVVFNDELLQASSTSAPPACSFHCLGDVRLRRRSLPDAANAPVSGCVTPILIVSCANPLHPGICRWPQWPPSSASVKLPHVGSSRIPVDTHLQQLRFKDHAGCGLRRILFSAIELRQLFFSSQLYPHTRSSRYCSISYSR